MTDEQEDNIVNRSDIETVLDSERQCDQIREEYKRKIQEIKNREYHIRKALQERICYLINISYLKGNREGIESSDKYIQTGGTRERYLKDDFVLSDDGKYIAVSDDGQYCRTHYIIPIDVIVSYDEEKDRKFAEYVETFNAKFSLDYARERYLEQKKDLEFWKDKFEKENKKFEALYRKIYEESEWNIDLEGFQHDGKRLEKF